MGIAIKLTNLDFINNKLGTVTPTSGEEEPRELVTPGEISISSSSEYTFAKQGIWYVSQNKNVNLSTAIAYLTFESTRGIVRFDYQQREFRPWLYNNVFWDRIAERIWY